MEDEFLTGNLAIFIERQMSKTFSSD